MRRVLFLSPPRTRRIVVFTAPSFIEHLLTKLAEKGIRKNHILWQFLAPAVTPERIATAPVLSSPLLELSCA
jgi:hypothetical protein